MNSKIKIIIIVGVLLIVLSVGAVLALALFSKTDENIISNLRVSYVYAEGEKEPTDSASHREVYLSTSAENKAKIAISSNVSNPRLVFQSSNEQVAYIQEEAGSYYIFYVGEGVATLTVRSVTNTEIYDYCTITVKQNFATDIDVVMEGSRIVTYCDDNGKAYPLYYNLIGDEVNLDLVEYTLHDPEGLITKTEWNAKEQKIDFICNTESKEGVVPVTIYAYAYVDGVKMITAQETVMLQVIKNKVEYIRAELYTDNDFTTESKIYYDGMDNKPAIYLGAQDSQFPNFIYIRLQKVYTNGSYEYVTYDQQNYIKVSFTSDESTSIETYVIDGKQLQITLTKFTTDAYNQLYSNVTTEPAKYEFVYWDERFRSPYEVADENGNIISYESSTVQG